MDRFVGSISADKDREEQTVTRVSLLQALRFVELLPVK
jgi:hypothetical protein